MRASYTVTRCTGGHVFTLYVGRLKYRAEEAYDNAKPEKGSIVTLTEHGDRERKVLRRSDQTVTDLCSRCKREINSAFAPARDSVTLTPVCDDCTRAQRHTRVSA
jgi:hypothetical protein